MSKSRKTFLWFVAAAVVVAVPVFVFRKPKEPGGTLKIGVIAPMTGNFAIFGERIRNGMELAKEDSVTSKPLEIIYEDACQPKDAVSAVKKLIDTDKISLLGGSFCLVGFVPVIPIAEQNKIIAFNTAANPDSTLNHPYVFSTNKSIKSDAEKLALFAAKNLKAKTATTLFYVTPLGLDYGKYFKQYFEEQGGKVLSEEQVDLNATDFRTQLAKIKSLHPDVVFVVHLAKSLGTFIKQTRELGIKSTLLSISEAEDPGVLQVAGFAAEGFVISSSEPTEKTPAVTSFEERYKQKFGNEADIIAANAYDALKLQILAYEKCAGQVGCMVDYLHQVKNYDGASGNITVNQDGSADKPVIWKVVRGGKFVKISGN